jgi:hypothetical protein
MAAADAAASPSQQAPVEWNVAELDSQIRDLVTKEKSFNNVSNFTTLLCLVALATHKNGTPGVQHSPGPDAKSWGVTCWHNWVRLLSPQEKLKPMAASLTALAENLKKTGPHHDAKVNSTSNVAALMQPR